MTYPGGKGSCYQKIINMIPPHRIYIEPFLGRGAIMAKKRPAELNIGIDVNPMILPSTAQDLKPGSTAIQSDTSSSVTIPVLKVMTTSSPLTRKITIMHSPDRCYWFICMDAVDFLKSYPFHEDVFIYCDPPYLMSTRSTQRPLYAYEYCDRDHERLLDCIKRLPCKVAISGYWSELYADQLADWDSISFMVQTRGGTMAEEWLWMNYPKPSKLHDYQYLGDNYRQRERIKRKKNRWISRLQRMSVLERRAILWAIRDAYFD